MSNAPRKPNDVAIDYPSPTHLCSACGSENDGATRLSLCHGRINYPLEGRPFFAFPLSSLTR
jgi:hypothetical protein